jgi:hypothetical protein
MTPNTPIEPLYDPANPPKKYTDDYLLAYGRACERAAYERAAQVAGKTVCDRHIPTGVTIYGTAAAAAIRALGADK